ncbi:MAG: hypothetical protein KGS09_08870 [Nitrospirae bacterium]|nr:hypothetical protein [Nitrospirota bacterium]
MNFRKPYAEPILSVGDGPKIHACDFYSKGYRSALATAGRVTVIITTNVTDQEPVVLEPYYGNKWKVNMVRLAANAYWNGLSAYLTYDFSGQLSLRIRGKIFKSAGEANTCIDSKIGSRCRRNFSNTYGIHLHAPVKALSNDDNPG